MRLDLQAREAAVAAVAGAAQTTQHRQEVLLRLLSFTARISSNCPRVLAELSSLYPVAATLARRHSMARSHRFHFRVTECRENGDSRFRVTAPEWGECVAESASQAVARLDSLLTTTALTFLKRHLLIHAGSVALAGRGILLPGPSGAGKSTLVAALCHAGFSYLSDEVAVLNLRTRRVLPFLKVICLKNGGWEALAREFDVQSSVVRTTRCDGELVRYLTAPRSSDPEDPIQVRHVLLTRRRPGSLARLAPVSRAEAAFELVHHSLNFPHHGRNALEVLGRVVEEAECYTLTYGELEGAVAAISEMVGHQIDCADG